MATPHAGSQDFSCSDGSGNPKIVGVCVATHLSKVNTHLSTVNTRLSKVNTHLADVRQHGGGQVPQRLVALPQRRACVGESKSGPLKDAWSTADSRERTLVRIEFLTGFEELCTTKQTLP